MRQASFFYDPELSGHLPDGEAHHALRVMRLGVGDELMVTDGKGHVAAARVESLSARGLAYRIEETLAAPPLWRGRLTLAVAPTKSADRMEWLVEKATEVGVDELVFLATRHCQRTHIAMERMEKVALAAMKQSEKAWLPCLRGMVNFSDFVAEEREGGRFICHCREVPTPDSHTSTLAPTHDPLVNTPTTPEAKPYLFARLSGEEGNTVLIGPEGDFSEEEVGEAERCGYQGVSLGSSRLRTETAALMALMQMQTKSHI